MGLVSVSESGHSCMKKMVTLHVPLWRNSQGKSFKIFLGEHRRGRQHNLKHKSQVLVAVALSVPSLPAAFDTMHDRTEHQMLMLQGQWSEKTPQKQTPSTCPHWLSLPLQTRTCKGAEPVWRGQDPMKGVEECSSSIPAIPPSPLKVAER